MDKFRYNGSIEEMEEEYRGEVIDCVEGCLIDSVLIETLDGYIALIETFCITWTSNYTCYIGGDEVYDVWEDFRDQIEKGAAV